MNVLFVCTLNKARSVAAERLYRRMPGLAVRSAGISERARHQVSEQDLLWADRIVVFDAGQERWIRAISPATCHASATSASRMTTPPTIPSS
jgi:protein-tyrosine-phosphatase